MATHTFNVLSLCTGTGGLDLGIRMAVPAARTVCCVEREAFCVEVLATRMEEQALDDAPVWSDLKTFDGKPWRGVVDLVTGGYPCQPFSLAGARKGADDPRHLWPDVKRIVEEVAPQLCFFENVAGHLSLGFEDVVRDLEEMGYRVAAGLFTAEEVGAPHRRERLFILAHADVGRRESVGSSGLLDGERPAHGHDVDGRSSSQSVGDPSSARLAVREPRAVAHALPAPWPPGPQGDWTGIPEEAQPAIRQLAHGASAGLAGSLDGPEDLRTLWTCVHAQALQERLCQFEEAAVLFPGVFTRSSPKDGSESGCLSETSSTLAEEVLRAVRKYGVLVDTPRESELARQPTDELEDALRFVSHVVASRAGRYLGVASCFAVSYLRRSLGATRPLREAPTEGESAWRSLSHEDKKGLAVRACVATVTVGRVDCLRALGNGVVPAQACLAFRTLAGVLLK